MVITLEIVRKGIFMALNLMNMLFFCDILMKRKRSIHLLAIYFLFRGVIWRIGVDLLLYQIYSQEMWFQLLKRGGFLFFATTSFLILNVTYEGGFLKTAIGSTLAETCSVLCGYSAIGVTCLITGRNFEDWMKGKFHIRDILFVFIIIFGAAAIRKYLKSLLQKFQKVQFRFAAFWWGLIIIYQIYVSYSQIMLVENELEKAYAHIYKIYFIVGFLLFIALFLMGIWETKCINLENRYLNIQKRLLDEHFQMLKCQELEVQRYQNEIARQIKLINESGIDCNSSQEQVKEYLESLQHIYDKNKVVEYCGNLSINAFINHKIVNQKKPVEILIQDIVLEEVEERKILLALKTIFDDEKELIKLKIYKKKKQIIIQYQLYEEKAKIICI